MAVLTEVGGHPVQYHAQPRPVQGIHQGHEVVGRAVAAGGGEVAGALVAPAVVQGVFRHRQQLYEVVAHGLYIGGQLLCQLHIAQGRAVLVALPRAQMHLVDQQLAVHRRLFQPLLPPVIVPPLVSGQVVDLAVCPGTGGRVEGTGIGLPDHPVVRAGDHILVGVVDLGVLRRRFPHAGIQPGHGPGLPAVEVPGQRYGAGVGCPHAEGEALLRRVRAEVGVDVVGRVPRHVLSSFSLTLLVCSMVARLFRQRTRNRSLVTLPTLYPIFPVPSTNKALFVPQRGRKRAASTKGKRRRAAFPFSFTHPAAARRCCRSGRSRPPRWRCPGAAWSPSPGYRCRYPWHRCGTARPAGARSPPRCCPWSFRSWPWPGSGSHR